MTGMTQSGLLVGALLPLLTAVVQQPRWSRRQRSLAAAGLSLAAGVVVVLLGGGFAHGLEDPLFTIAAVMAAAEATYEKVWQPKGVAAAIERVTSPAPSPETADWE